MSIQLTPQDAFAALGKRLNSGEPVIATFNMVGNGEASGILMYVEVDGKRQDFTFTLGRSGGWTSQLTRDI